MEREFCVLPYQSQVIRNERAPTVGKFIVGSDKTEKICHNVLGTQLKEMGSVSLFRSGNISG